MKLNPAIKILYSLLLTVMMLVLISESSEAATYDLTTEYNLRIDGAGVDDKITFQDLDMYDIDGNGIDDLIFRTNSGGYAQTIIFDSLIEDHLTANGGNFNLSDSDNYSLKLYSYYNSYIFVDINDDGKLDLVSGVYYSDIDGHTDNGAVYIILNDQLIGNPNGTELNIAGDNIANTIIYGANDGDILGFGLDGALDYGDYDGDGKVDIAVSAVRADYGVGNGGSVYLIPNAIFSDNSFGTMVDLDDPSNYGVRIDGAYTGSGSYGLAYPDFTDINNDGVDEIFVTCGRCSYGGTSYAGRSYLISDDLLPVGVGNSHPLSLSSNYNVQFVKGGPTQDRGSKYLNTDFTGNGDSIVFADVSTYEKYFYSNTALRSYIQNSGVIVEAPDSTKYTFKMTGAQYPLMNSVSDYDNDSLLDIFISDMWADDNGNNTGNSYLIPNNIITSFTSVGESLDLTDSSSTTITFYGDSNDPTYSSQMYYQAGDINGDDKNDFLFGTDWSSFNGSRSGSLWIVLNYPHTITTSDLNEYDTSTSQTITGTISAPLSIMEIGGAQWSLSNDPLGTWNECNADDGTFDGTSEDFTCNVSFGEDGVKTVYVRSYDENGSYTAVSNYAQVGTTIDTNKPSDSYENTDHEIVKVGGEDVDDKGSKDPEGNEIGKGYSDSNKPKIEFEKIGDDLSGVDKYEIRITNTNDGLSTKDGEDYLWIDDIPHEGDDGEKRERDGVEIEYKGDRIKIKPKDNKYELDDGAYYMRIRSYDNAGNFNESSEVKVYIGREEDCEGDNEDCTSNGSGENEGSNSDQSNITLEKIGTIPYTENYSTYYYTAHNLTLSGTGTEGNVVLKINDEEASNAETVDGRFSIGSTLITGSHKIEINGIVFSLVVDPTRELFPESLK